jgi:hypothetical protein
VPIVADGKIIGAIGVSGRDERPRCPVRHGRRRCCDGQIRAGTSVAPACPTPPRHYGTAEFVTKPVDFDSLERQLRQLSPS